MPEKELFKVLGALLEVVCAKIVHTILGRAHNNSAIEIPEAERICLLISHVKDYQGISLLSHFTPSWGKFCRIRDVLSPTQKLKPLLDGVAQGGYDDFRLQEFAKLVSVVWTESAIRRYNVDTELAKRLT